MPKNPMNVVLIMTDQQRWDMLRCHGSEWMHTPHLDRLAAAGCRFTKAYTTTPVCTPARAALMTGMYASSAGASANQDTCFRATELLGEMLTRQGVAAGYSGKWHLSGMEGDYYGNGKCEGGFMPEYWYDGRNFIDDVSPEGFRRWDEGQGLADQDCWGTRVADRAVRFIEKHRGGPFFFCASFDEPHSPMSAPERFYRLYEGSTRPWRGNMADDLADKPAVHRAYREGHPGGHVPYGTRPNNNPRYYGCMSFVDEQIGRIVEAVDRLCPDDTAIIFTSDHGDHHGAHGLLGKGPTMYEETARVPMLARVPGVTRPGSVCEGLVSHIHYVPTILRLLGLPAHPQAQAGDLLPLLQDPAGRLTDAVFLEYGRFGVPHTHWWGFMPSRCIRAERWKLVVNLLDRDELYDLEADSGELVNRIDDPALAEVRNGLHDRLLEWMEGRLDPLRGRGWHVRPWRPGFDLDPRQRPRKK